MGRTLSWRIAVTVRAVAKRLRGRLEATLLRRLLRRGRGGLPDRTRRSRLTVRRFGGFDAYRATNDVLAERDRRLRREGQLVVNDDAFVVPGRCHVCGEPADFRVNFRYSWISSEGIRTPNWREHLQCPRCGLNSRMRAAIHLLEQECGVSRLSRIYVTEQCTSLFRALQGRYHKLTGSEYLGTKVPFGQFDEDGFRNETVVQLTFPSGGFDCVLSFDVLEHVPDYKAALAEFRRCLATRGHLLLSVPFISVPHTVVRARVGSDDAVVHLLPPEYHGDALNPEGCLAFYHFGWDILDDLRDVGFSEAWLLTFWSEEYGYMGNGEQVMILARNN
jgi:SAM-dependent methyltransferase